MKTLTQNQYSGESFITFWNEPRGEERLGVYAFGGCDLHTAFACAPLIAQVWDGTCSILKEGKISDARSDLVLQTLRDHRPEDLAPVIEKFRLAKDIFRPRLFEKTFVVEGPDGPEEFPKSVILLDFGPDVNRTVYRNRETGLLVDPGAGWLDRPFQQVLGELSAASWFRDRFENIGQIGVEAFAENFTKIIGLLKTRIGVPILVYNVLTVEPRTRIHTYQFVNNPQVPRRREFNLALVELSRRLDFSIVDMDRLLKGAGLETQLDFGHLDPRLNIVVAQEVVRIMRDCEVTKR